jgi:hypothetical protein
MVTITGDEFKPGLDVDVSLWDGAQWHLIKWLGHPTANGTIYDQFTVPNMPPGNYWIGASQYAIDTGQVLFTITEPQASPPPSDPEPSPPVVPETPSQDETMTINGVAFCVATLTLYCNSVSIEAGSYRQTYELSALKYRFRFDGVPKGVDATITLGSAGDCSYDRHTSEWSSFEFVCWPGINEAGELAKQIVIGGMRLVWEHTDRAIKEGIIPLNASSVSLAQGGLYPGRTSELSLQQITVARTWMWGPEPMTPVIVEDYSDSPDGVRVVQYFDKTRMEITDPAADQNSTWYVTNGLLVNELITGRRQFGHNTFEELHPANINVAGDADDNSGVTYATFDGLEWNVPEVGSIITQRVDRAGNVTDDQGLAWRDVRVGIYVPETNHTVAAPFWEFMNSTGIVWKDGAYVMDKLFENPFYATGLPVTEAYWANIKVGGTYKDVLMQCFERRCLTYTPDNPDGWKVEAGNVGQHYYTWRYE